MRTRRNWLIIPLILLLLMSGCDSAGTAETTLPPETTVPVETTLPPETTLPAATEPSLPTVEEMIHNYDELIQAGFVHVHGTLYLDKAGEVCWNGTPYFQYTGESSTIPFPGFGLKLTLPDGWKNHFSVVVRSGDAESFIAEILLFNNAVFEAQMEYALSESEQTGTRETVYGPYCDYSLKIKAISHECFVVNQESGGGAVPSLIPTDPYEGIYVGEDENYVYWAILPGDEFYDNERYHIQRFLIEKIGEEAYNELLGDLVLDYDMVRDMITISPTEPEATVSVLDGIPFHEAYEADGFVHFYGEPLYTENGGGLYYQLYYQYAGDSPVIELRSMGITLTLPEEWLDQVMVIRYWNHPYNEGLYIVNKSLWNAYQEESPAAGPNNGLQDFILSIYCLPTSRYSGPEQFSGSSMEYLHEVDQLVYFLIMGMPEDSHFTSVRNDLIQKIGQDAYDELVGDLVLDFETAKGMITFMY